MLLLLLEPGYTMTDQEFASLKPGNLISSNGGGHSNYAVWIIIDKNVSPSGLVEYMIKCLYTEGLYHREPGHVSYASLHLAWERYD